MLHIQRKRLPADAKHPPVGAPALRASPVRLLTAIIAAAGIAGIAVVLTRTNAGSAPGNGEQIFDAPGCGPEHYDGPGHRERFPADRDCPTPVAVIVLHSRHARDGWHVIWDGSRSFDPNSEKLIRYVWRTGASPGPHVIHQGVSMSLIYRKPGLYSVALYVTDKSGSIGTATYTVRVR